MRRLLKRVLCFFEVHTLGCRGMPNHSPFGGFWKDWDLG